MILIISNIVKKANLSADKQAVREMNEALAQWEAANGYPEVKDVEQAQMILKVMQILADAGYNTDNWVCLTQGYEVYWFKNDNRMVLYNAKEAAIEYPDEYVGTKIMVNAENGFFLYNENHVKAQSFDVSLTGSKNSAGKYVGSTNFTSVAATVQSGVKSNQAANLSAISSSVASNNAVKNAIASSEGKSSASTIYMYATREIVSSSTSNAYASLQVAAVGTEENPVKLKSDGELKENLYYLSVVADSSTATAAEIASAQAAAGQYLYNIFDQISTGKIDAGSTIIVDGGTVLNCEACEWAPCKTFCGYFGTSDSNNPVVIDGARLTAATGFASTVSFTGSGSKYFVTGVFGTVYGNATIENVTFKNISIVSPANDYELTASDRNNKKTNTRNTVGIIGGITDGYEPGKIEGVEANVTLKNIKVESSCSITGAGCAGGLVGYIGSANADGQLIGTINIDNCEVYADVTSTDNMSSNDYKSVGAIIGFSCRVNANTKINITGCKAQCKVTSYGNVGGVAGAFQSKPTVRITNGDYSGVTLEGAYRSAAVAGYIDNASTPITMTGASLVSSKPHTFIKTDGYTINASGNPTKN